MNLIIRKIGENGLREEELYLGKATVGLSFTVDESIYEVTKVSKNMIYISIDCEKVLSIERGGTEIVVISSVESLEFTLV